MKNSKSIQQIELMAPAGNFESLQAALDNGADSIDFCFGKKPKEEPS